MMIQKRLQPRISQNDKLSFSSSLSMLLSTSTRYTLRTKRKMCTASPKHKLS